LSAPHFRANEAALALLARAARVVRGRDEAGGIVVQTRQPDHPVLAAAVASEPQRLEAAERELRAAMRLPPFAALAQLSLPPAPTRCAAGLASRCLVRTIKTRSWSGRPITRRCAMPSSTRTPRGSPSTPFGPEAHRL
jgi:primosomal protein N'